MIGGLVVGAGIGAGLVLAARALITPRLDLQAAVGRFDARQRWTGESTAEASQHWRARIGQTLAIAAARRGWLMPRLRANLALLDRTIEAHLATKLMFALVGLFMPALCVAVVALAGIELGWSVPALLSLVFAAVLFVVPDLSVAQAAQRRREELRRTLACYLDLVAMALAGGRGAPEALPAAAGICQGWGFDLLADTVGQARYTPRTPWELLAELGERVDVAELRDLGTALMLVADDGAKVRDSLQARAATARDRQLALVEGAAERGSQSIRYAHLILGFGFFTFLLYPAVIEVMAL